MSVHAREYKGVQTRHASKGRLPKAKTYDGVKTVYSINSVGKIGYMQKN